MFQGFGFRASLLGFRGLTERRPEVLKGIPMALRGAHEVPLEDYRGVRWVLPERIRRSPNRQPQNLLILPLPICPGLGIWVFHKVCFCYWTVLFKLAIC